MEHASIGFYRLRGRSMSSDLPMVRRRSLEGRYDYANHTNDCNWNRQGTVIFHITGILSLVMNAISQ